MSTDPARRIGPAALALVLAPAAALCAGLLPVPLAALAVGITFGYVPGRLVAGVLAPQADRTVRLLLACGLSPFLAGAPGALMMLAGATPPLAARAIAAGWMVLTVLALLRRSAAPPAAPRAAWLAAAAWTVLVAAVLFGNPLLPPRSDGWYHAAIAGQIAQRGLPPEDPFFAGIPLLYFWGYHAWTALWLALDARLTVWVPLVSLNLAGAFVVVLGTCAIARRLGAGARGVWANAVVTTLGYSPFAWVWIAVRTLTGEVTGLEELRRIMQLGVDPVLQYMTEKQLHVSMVFFGDKALVLTPFGMGLALLTAFVLAFHDFLERPSVRAAVLLAVIEAATLWLHTVVGLSALLLAGAWWVVELARRRGAPDALRRAWWAMPLVLGAALALLLPYLVAVTRGKQGSGQLGGGFTVESMGSAILGGALIVPAGLAWLWRRRNESLPRLMLPMVTTLLALGLLLRLSENNQSKFFNMLFLLLAPPAALAWSGLLARLHGVRRLVLAAVLIAGMAPTLVLSLWGFLSERGQNVESWVAPSPGEREACEWLRQHTPADALVADVAGSRDVMTLAARTAIWGGPVAARDWGHPKATLALRRTTAEALCAARPLDEAQAAFVRELGRPIVVLARRRDAGPESAWAVLPAHPDYQLIHTTEDVRIYRWEGER